MPAHYDPKNLSPFMHKYCSDYPPLGPAKPTPRGVLVKNKSSLLKKDEPGTLLVYTPWHMASVWNSALESLGEEVELKLEPTPMYVIEKPDGLPNAGNSSEQYDAVTMVLVAHRTGQAVSVEC